MSQAQSELTSQTNSSVKVTIESLLGDGSKLTDLTGIVERDEVQYIGGGNFGDVYKGIWKHEVPDFNRPEIVIKVLRTAGKCDPKVLAKQLKVRSYSFFNRI